MSGALGARALSSQNGATDTRLGKCPNQASSETIPLLSETTNTEKKSVRALHGEKRRDARRSAVLRERSGLFRRAPRKLPFFDSKDGIARALYFQEKDDSLYLGEFTDKVVIGIASRRFIAAAAFKEEYVNGDQLSATVIPRRAVPLASLLTVFMNRNNPGEIDADYLVFIFHTGLTETGVEKLEAALRNKLFEQLPNEHFPKKNGGKYIYVYKARGGAKPLTQKTLEIKFQGASLDPMVHLEDNEGRRETSCIFLTPE